MDLDAALAIAEAALDQAVRRPGIEIVIMRDKIREYDEHWVFFYDTREFVETGAMEAGLLGNVPVVVDKTTGRHWFARPVISLEEQLRPPPAGHP